jgi:cobalt-zinc-cadmium resistance protein CzcA
MEEQSFEIVTTSYQMQVSRMQEMALENHPVMDWYEQNEGVFLQEKKVNFSHQLPDINLGYFNQTLVGIQNVNGYDTQFTQANRFQGYMVGVNVPLFWGAFKSRNEVSTLSMQQNVWQKEQSYQSMQRAYVQLSDQLNVLMESIDALGGQLNNELQYLNEDAKIKYEVGEISFIEFLQIQQQRSDLELSYLQLVNQFNQTNIQLNWYR